LNSIPVDAVHGADAVGIAVLGDEADDVDRQVVPVAGFVTRRQALIVHHTCDTSASWPAFS